ncbi:hypothetical protein CRG98_006163 [Punica granatum]|uniref:Uncharacterized protein n=1 Tax=Punica granatum TaxID=22663 RepID=A0A2I0KYB3_PUNGR|nr:hypothetical protein CRG98_006163 [Punica granatum]
MQATDIGMTKAGTTILFTAGTSEYQKKSAAKAEHFRTSVEGPSDRALGALIPRANQLHPKTSLAKPKGH